MKFTPRNTATMAIVAVVILLFVALHLHQELKVAGAPGFPLDDAWIHSHFARNLARGYGMSYNPGIPVSGSTAPLWTLMLAAAYLVVPNVIISAKVMSLVLYALVCLLVFKILIRLLDDVHFAFLGALLTAMTSRLMWGALSGMEVMLSVFLTTGGIYLHLLYRAETGPKQYARTGVFALASLARPESLLLIFLALIDDFLISRVDRKEKLPSFAVRAATHLFFFFLLLSPYFVFNYLSVGSLFPSTYLAKRGGGLLPALAHLNLQELHKSVFSYPALYVSNLLEVSRSHNVFLYWLMFVGMAMVLARSFRKGATNEALLIPLTFILYPVLVGALAPSRMGLRWMFRYMSNLTPLYVVMAVVGLQGCVSFIRTILKEFWVKEKMATSLTRGILAVVVAMLLVSLSIEEYENSKFYALGVQNINEMQVRIGRWARENTPPDTLLAVNDIGAIAYFSERKVLDLGGLVTPEILSYRDKENGVFEFVARNKPDYVIFFPNWFPDFPAHDELIPVFSISLELNAVCGGPTMAVYKTVWAEERETQRRASAKSPKN
ncbi:MAG: hypothetical protein C4532_13030 [Candidatus Abyssobacteria bacterium SURF_17]|uniref:Glycosyltransferase RgtA/B/C/D-like domain-containing protein n=1 Tax=Candidatus Abyssobacteria bacterium SURF_17 TaxID=2093361 RepID=A0A419EV72_9BACT|nr:MAG: hypothetical protein C4532_13030 [Candidatus Abyssubacteria bacterium SURF_17]